MCCRGAETRRERCNRRSEGNESLLSWWYLPYCHDEHPFLRRRDHQSPTAKGHLRGTATFGVRGTVVSRYSQAECGQLSSEGDWEDQADQKDRVMLSNPVPRRSRF